MCLSSLPADATETTTKKSTKNNVPSVQQPQPQPLPTSSSKFLLPEEEQENKMTTSGERAALLLRDSPTARTSTSFADSEEDDEDSAWEDISISQHHPPEISRVWYWVTHTGPILLYDAIRLALFVVFLAPAFCRFLYYYLITSDRQVVRYKESSSWRHVVDLYGAVPTTTSSTTSITKKPVLIFFTGGAWVIGYKMWGAFLAKVFCAMGVLVVIPDYPNYPFVTVPDMVEDAEVAIQWTLDTIEQYGGDSTRVILAGQSAGGHLASCVLLRKALQLLQGKPITGFLPNQLAGFCSISAPSDVQAMATNFQKHGLDQTFVQSLFGCHSPRNTCMDDYDPQRLVEQLQREVDLLQAEEQEQLQTMVPPMSIFHGTADKTVPYEVSEKFAASLQQAGVNTEYIAYEGWSHTDPILEAIMMADHRFHADLYDRLYQWTSSSSSSSSTSSNTSSTTRQQSLSQQSSRVIPLQLDDSIPECQPLCPTILVQAARFCNPF